MIYAVYNTKNAHALVFVVRGLVIQLAATVGDRHQRRGTQGSTQVFWLMCSESAAPGHWVHVFGSCDLWQLGCMFEPVVMQNSMMGRNCGGRRSPHCGQKAEVEETRAKADPSKTCVLWPPSLTNPDS